MVTVIRRFAETTAAPWRNGLGQTWALFDDRGAWRLSVARLEAPAVFSVFPRVHRTLVPRGGGIRLEIDGEVHDVREGEPVRFSGEADTRLVALDRPCHAVNLLASGHGPTLVSAAAGTRFDDAVFGVATEAGGIAARFDTIQLDPGEPLPCASAVVRGGGGGADPPGSTSRQPETASA